VTPKEQKPRGRPRGPVSEKQVQDAIALLKRSDLPAAEIARHFGLRSVEGVIVTAVKKDGPAGKAGIEEQDIILQVNRTRIENLKEYNQVMAKSAERESVLLLIKRGNAQYYVAIRK